VVQSNYHQHLLVKMSQTPPADGCDYAASASSLQQARAVARQVDEARRAFAVYRSSQPRGSSIDFARHLMETFESRKDSLVK